jgi:thiosulfate/3-mercaptopyruvate sulfurtransferase
MRCLVLRRRLECVSRVVSALLLVAPMRAGAQPTATPVVAARDGSRLISAAALAAAGENDVVILQVGSLAQFEAGRVPGARLVTLTDVSTPRVEGALALEVPDIAVLERWARTVGLTDAARIVVVPATDTLQSSTRVLFTLEVMGFGDRVSLLDGGLTAWRAAGRPVAVGPASPPAPVTGALTVRVDSSRIATISDVAAAVEDPDVAIIDARLPQFYAGNGGGYPRPGHIPTAVNIPLTLVSRDGALVATDSLRALFAAAGIREGDRAIVYCPIGQQASLVWFAARELGIDARIFDGSFQEWSGSDRPVIAR